MPVRTTGENVLNNYVQKGKNNHQEEITPQLPFLLVKRARFFTNLNLLHWLNLVSYA